MKAQQDLWLDYMRAVKEKDKEDSKVFHLPNGKAGLLSNERRQCRAGFGSKIRNSDLGMLYLRYFFFYQRILKNLEPVREF